MSADVGARQPGGLLTYRILPHRRGVTNAFVALTAAVILSATSTPATAAETPRSAAARVAPASTSNTDLMPVDLNAGDVVALIESPYANSYWGTTEDRRQPGVRHPVAQQRDTNNLDQQWILSKAGDDGSFVIKNANGQCLEDQTLVRCTLDAGQRFYVSPASGSSRPGEYNLRRVSDDQCWYQYPVNPSVPFPTSHYCVNVDPNLVPRMHRERTFRFVDPHTGRALDLSGPAILHALTQCSAESKIIRQCDYDAKTSSRPGIFAPTIASKTFYNGDSATVTRNLNWTKTLAISLSVETTFGVQYEQEMGTEPLKQKIVVSWSTKFGAQTTSTESLSDWISMPVAPGAYAWVVFGSPSVEVTGTWTVANDMGATWSGDGRAVIPVKNDKINDLILACTSDSNAPLCDSTKDSALAAARESSSSSQAVTITYSNPSTELQVARIGEPGATPVSVALRPTGSQIVSQTVNIPLAPDSPIRIDNPHQPAPLIDSVSARGRTFEAEQWVAGEAFAQTLEGASRGNVAAGVGTRDGKKGWLEIGGNLTPPASRSVRGFAPSPTGTGTSLTMDSALYDSKSRVVIWVNGRYVGETYEGVGYYAGAAGLDGTYRVAEIPSHAGDLIQVGVIPGYPGWGVPAPESSQLLGVYRVGSGVETVSRTGGGVAMTQTTALRDSSARVVVWINGEYTGETYEGATHYASAVAIDSGKLDVYFGKIDASPGDLVQIGIVPGGPGSPLGDPRSSNLLYEARL